MSPLQSFHLFSSLPTEIRLEIWQYKCNINPRVVEVSYNSEEDRCITTRAPPPVIQICRESRNEALRSCYKKLFGTNTYEAAIYFNICVDTLYIARPSKMGYDDTSRDFASFVTGTEEVLNLALDHVDPAIRRPWETYNKYALMQSFSQVKEVYLVLSSESPESPPESEEIKPGYLRLAEPNGDPVSMCKLLADVKESFSYEVGAEFQMDDDDKDDKDGGLRKTPPLVLKSKYLKLL